MQENEPAYNFKHLAFGTRKLNSDTLHVCIAFDNILINSNRLLFLEVEIMKQ